MRLLNIESSPRGSRSASIAVTNAFLEAYRQARPEVTVDTLIEQRTIFGSPKTVLTELAALRRNAGPFGTLLLSAIDWSGPNAAWERESLRRLAEDVMPALRAQSAAA